MSAAGVTQDLTDAYLCTQQDTPSAHAVSESNYLSHPGDKLEQHTGNKHQWGVRKGWGVFLVAWVT